MFYFDEDHMENGFDAPEVSDHEEDRVSKDDRHQTGDRVREQHSPGKGRPSQGKGWKRANNSGSTTTTSSTGSYSGGRYSSETASRRSPSERSARFHLGRDSERFHPVGGEFDDLDGWDSESDDQPAELVPLGMRSINLSGCNNRHRHRKSRSNFNDFYKLTDEHLGSGAYASVRTGVAIATGKEFAVKLVDKHEPGHTRSRIMREVETFNMCKNHPNIVQLHEWFEDNDYFYMVFEKMRGGPLLNHIQQKGFFTEQEASKVTRDIATALKFLHDHGIAHRDVKPENVLCSDFDRVSPVKLCDLDLASKAAPPSPPKLPSVNSEPDLASPVGSAEFMAPEVVDAFVGDALKYDKRCDMWSLGVIIYIMICGYPPFYGQCWRENCGWDEGLSCSDCQENLFKRIQRGEFDFPDPEWENVSEEAKDLICHLLVKNVRDRFTADEVLKHPWVRNGAPKTELQTPGNLFRNDSARDVHQMQEHFNVMNRMVAARLSARMEKMQIDSSESDEESKVTAAPNKCVLGVTDGQETKTNDFGFVIESNNNDVKKMPAVITAKPARIVPLQEQIAPQVVQAAAAEPCITNVSPVNTVTLTAAAHHAPNQILMPPPPVPPAPPVTVAQQVPMHVSQMTIGNTVAYGGGLPMSGVTIRPLAQGVHPVPFHPNQMINMNGMIVYPHPFITQQVLPPQQLISQQMYKYGVVPQQFMAPPPPGNVGLVPHYTQRGSNGYHAAKGDQQGSRANSVDKQLSSVVPPNGVITVKSAGALAVGTQPTEHLETCQTAMARQDSKSDLPRQARETQVNV